MKEFSRWISVLLVVCVVLTMPVYVKAADNQRASLFFAVHDVYIYKTGGNNYKACVDVTATGVMQEIGATSVSIQRSSDGVNWTTIYTFTSEDYPELVAKNTFTHYWEISRTAGSNMCYRLKVVLWAKDYRGTGSLTVYSYPVWF